jgi:hypothetical protein
MIPTRQFYCDSCDSGWTLSAADDSVPCCPGCRRDSLVAVNAPSGSVTSQRPALMPREAIAAGFRAIRESLEA